MKHSILFFSLAVVLVTMGILIVNMKEKPSGRLISLTQYHSYLYQTDLIVEVPLYVNSNSSPLLHQESYGMIAFMDGDGAKKIDLELESITAGYPETYLNETYYAFNLRLLFPDLGEDFWIDDLWLSFDLVNDDHYDIELGSLSVIYPVSDSGHLSWNILEGSKASDGLISRLKTIEITFEDLSDSIEKIEIGKDMSVDFQIDQNMIILTIPEKNQLLADVPILIYFADGSRQDIFNFRYMIEYDTLSENGLVMHTYATD